ncbi:MAG: response regulator [Fidelibacterota bacterium]
MMTKSKLVLIVEDSPDDGVLTLRALEKSKLRNGIVVKVGGEDALDYLLRRRQYKELEPGLMPDLILLDLKMPKVGGLEVLKQLRADDRTKLIPVVIFTSSKADQDLLECYNLGVNSYVRKPVESKEFRKTVEQIEHYWTVLNQPPPG